MDRLFTFWRKYTSISTTSEKFITEHAKIIFYKANSYFSRYYEVKPYWCFLLQGIASGIRFEENGTERITWLAMPPDYFTGTKHSYSNHGENLDIKFLVYSQIAAIPLDQMRYAQKHMADVAELIQVLKQRKLTQQKQLLEITKLPYGIDQYVAFRHAFPELSLSLTIKQTSQFLNIGEKTCQRGKLKFIGK